MRGQRQQNANWDRGSGVVSTECGVGSFHGLHINLFSLTPSVIAFQLLFMSPLNLYAFLFQATIQLVCGCTCEGTIRAAPDCGGRQGSVSPSLPAPTVPLTSHPPDWAGKHLYSGSGSTAITYNHGNRIRRGA